MWFRLDAGATADEVTWRREKRVILDIIVQHADVATLEAVVERTSMDGRFVPEANIGGATRSPRRR